MRSRCSRRQVSRPKPDWACRAVLARLQPGQDRRCGDTQGSRYEAEQAAGQVLLDQGVASGWAQPACAGSFGAPLDPDHVLNCLGDGMKVADDGDELVLACLCAEHAQRSGERVDVERAETLAQEMSAQAFTGTAVHLDDSLDKDADGNRYPYTAVPSVHLGIILCHRSR